VRWGRKPSHATPPDVAAVRVFRRTRAKRESPKVLFWTGTATLVLTILNMTIGFLDLPTFVMHFIITVIMWLAAYVVSRRGFPARWVTSLVGLCAVIVTAEFQFEFWINPTPMGFGYVLMIMIAGAPIMLSPLVQSQVALLAIIGSIHVIQHTPQSVLGVSQPGDWMVTAATAEVIGFILLFMRLRSIDELGLVTRQGEVNATIDPLTGLFNRRGLESEMTRIITLARVSRTNVFACFVDIDWLKTANDAHGHAFGDQVIRVVAAAVRSCAPPSAVIARWGGDEFLIFGTGDPIEDDIMTIQLFNYIANSKLDMSKWPGSVSVGSASAVATDLQLGDLIYQADERMYARRRAKRSGN
jgi:diguanylate cyclase (GGDEF)-like protein